MRSTNHTTGHAACCTEYARLSRRGFLRTSGAAAAALASAPAWLPRVSFARSYDPRSRDVILQIYLRGGADGMTLVPPFADPSYAAIRPTIGFAHPDDTSRPVEERAVNLTGFFGLARGMEALLPAYQNGHLLIMHAAGSTDPSRSHFDAQRIMEVGRADDPLLFTGWLGRHLASVDPLDPSAPLRAMAINDAIQLTLAGGPRTLPFNDLSKVGLDGDSTTEPARRATLQSAFGGRPDPLSVSAVATLQTLDTLGRIDFAGYVPAAGANYDQNSGLHQSLRMAAALIKAQVGVEAVAMDYGGWDTHSMQGPFAGGDMFATMVELSTAIAAFYADMVLSNQPQRIVLVVMSEFGRRAAENGDRGTDHGHGNVMFVLGHQVIGGRVLANWPGLHEEQLDDGDLQVTTDYRDVLAEIIARRLGNAPGLASVFPAHTPVFQNVVRTA